MPSCRRTKQRDEQGTITVMVIGFTFIMAMLVAVVVDATAAYLQRSSLSVLADGAALSATETINDTYYLGSYDGSTLPLLQGESEALVSQYLRNVDAYADHPGLQSHVSVDGGTVTVTMSDSLDLPLTVPGAVESARISSTASARLLIG